MFGEQCPIELKMFLPHVKRREGVGGEVRTCLMRVFVKERLVMKRQRLELHLSTFLEHRYQEIAPAERMDNVHGILIIANQAPIGYDLGTHLIGFNIIDDGTDMSLKGFCFEMCFSKRAKSIYAKHNLVSIFTEH